MPVGTDSWTGPGGAAECDSSSGEKYRAGVVLRAPAKINLYLEVLGRRNNGYHDIRTVIAPVSLYDTVRLDLTQDRVETVWENGREGDQSLVRSDDNLTTKAAQLLRDLTGRTEGVRIHLRKSIPIGGVRRPIMMFS